MLNPRLIAGTPAGVLDCLSAMAPFVGNLVYLRSKFRSICVFGFLLVLLVADRPTCASAQEEKPTSNAAAKTIAPPSNLKAKDHPNDTGQAIDLEWNISADDPAPPATGRVLGYDIFRLPADRSKRDKLTHLAAGSTQYTDRTGHPGAAYLYEVVAVGAGNANSEPARLEKPVRGVLQWFNSSRAWFGVILAIVCGGVILFTELAKSGRGVYIREIAGLKAIEEAVGRATEMGRPCLFVPGLQDINETPTVAGIAILSNVAKFTADYDATLEVPTARSLVMTAARETVHAAYLTAGRLEAYNEDRIYYVTDEQFAYVAYLTGYMVREKPAACFYAGIFFAESLILAETGNSIGAIQIAGTSETSQLPFFVAACDYTLIGEELFAASAYLSGEPHQLGSLKGQDAGKVLAGLLLLAGCLVATLAAVFPDWNIAQETLAYLKSTILGKGPAG